MLEPTIGITDYEKKKRSLPLVEIHGGGGARLFNEGPAWREEIVEVVVFPDEAPDQMHRIYTCLEDIVAPRPRTLIADWVKQGFGCPVIASSAYDKQPLYHGSRNRIIGLKVCSHRMSFQRGESFSFCANRELVGGCRTDPAVLDRFKAHPRS